MNIQRARIRSNLLHSACVLTLPLSAVPVALAQTSQPPAVDQSVGDIVVTAQRRTESLARVPVSVSVVTGDTLKQNAIINLNELAPKLPNVAIYEGGNSDVISIRGVNSGSNSGFEQAVGTFVDGAYRGRARSMRASLFDVERIEVLRGPQTTFFGNSAIAGAFNITTVKPVVGDPLKADASALYEFNHNEYDFRGGISLPLGDTLAVRAAVGYSGMDGWVSNAVSGHREPQRKDLLGRLSLAWQPTDNLHIDLRYDKGRLRTKGTWWAELTACPPDPSFGLTARGACAAYLAARGPAADVSANYRGDKPGGFDRLDTDEIAMSATLDLGSATLTSNTTYAHHDFYQSITLIPVDIPSPAGSKSWFQFQDGEKYKQFTQELRLQSNTDGALRWMVGAYYLRSKLDHDFYLSPTFLPFGSFGALPSLGFNARSVLVGRTLDRREDRLFSTFASLGYDLTSRLRINAGLRYSLIKKEGHRQLTSGTATSDPLTPETFAPATLAQQIAINQVLGYSASDFPNTRRKEQPVMPSAGIEFDLTPSILTYARYARGEKAGGWSMGVTANEFEAETVNAFEVGIKGYAFDRKLFFTLAAFKSNYRDLQEASNNTLPNGSFVVRVTNAASSVSQGIELGLNARAADWLTLTFDGAYLDSHYIRYPNATCDSIQATVRSPCIQDLSGRRRMMSPKFSGQIGARARLPVGAYRLSIEPTLSFRSSFYFLATLDPVAKQDAFAKLDTRISLSPEEGAWQIALVGKNITNTRDAALINALTSSAGSSTTNLSRPRSIALQASMRF